MLQIALRQVWTDLFDIPALSQWPCALCGPVKENEKCLYIFVLEIPLFILIYLIQVNGVNQFVLKVYTNKII